MNNLQIFRKSVDQFLNQSDIKDIDRWKQLLSHLCDIKILSPKQQKILNQNVQKRSFPIKVKEFQEIIMKEFGDEPTKLLIKDIDQIKKQIRQTKGILAVWKQQGLSAPEVKALEILFARGNSKMKQICAILNDKKKLLQSISEPQIQMIKAMDQWVVMQKIKQPYENFEEYQQINSKAIQNLYNQLRVRQVYFRTKNTNKHSQDFIHSVLGFNSKTDEQIQVTKIPKKLNDFNKVNAALVTFNAYRDLMLSPYFVRFLGYNTSADPHYYYYFKEFIETQNLQHLIKNSTTKLEEHFSILKFWAGEIFRALKDIFYSCSYQPIFPITLKDIEVAQYGLRVILKHVKFYAPRELSNNIEPRLLENVGKLILQLLQIDQNEIQTKIKAIQNRNLIYTLLKAKEGLKKYEQKIVPCFINFKNAQSHPLFESIKQTKCMDIIDNYTFFFHAQRP